MSLIRTTIINLVWRKFKLAALVLVATVFAMPTFSATVQEERWFEIEVILFSQLSNKTQLKESFPDQEQQPSALPNYRRIKDLLTPYIYPDLTTIKLQLPQCVNLSKQKLLVEPTNTQQKFYLSKSLEKINQTLFEDEITSTNIDGLTNDNTVIDHTVPHSTVSNITVVGQPMIGENELTSSITPQQLALVSEAEVAFTHLKFEYSNLLTEMSFCNSPKIFDDKFSINLQGTIDGNEYIDSEQPYLINKDSLQLTDIVTSLARNNNFKPLLHLGWREAPKDRNQATAHRIFAGDNLAFEYEKAQLDYQAQLQKILIQDAIVKISTKQINARNAQFDDEVDVDVDSETATMQILQTRVNNILSKVNDVTASDEQAILAQLTDKSLAIDINTQDSINMPSKPIKPIQPWTLDGLFRVHLNHYLYITADFNLLNLTPKQQEQKKLAINELSALKSIRFNQNRRVISGEIHYFDHPYIGMIVQIRKYQRPEPEEIDALLENDNESAPTTNQ